jgi:hypothetical protein
MWRSKVLSVGTDGEPTMTGHVTGVQTRFEDATDHPIVRVWCGLHQLDLVVQREYASLHDEEFTSILVNLISHLRRQQLLQNEMGSTCPKFVDTRWLSMKRVSAWLKKNRVRVFQHLDLKKPACAPPAGWWVGFLCVDSIATILSFTVQRPQGLSTLLSQQEAQLRGLLASLSELCTVEGPWQPKPLPGPKTASGSGPETHVVRGQFSVALSDALIFMKDQGTFVIDTLAEMDGEEVAGIARGVANLFAGLFDGITGVVATRGPRNQSSTDALPPVLPHSLAAIRTGELCEMTRPHRARLASAGWTTQEVEQIEEDHRGLRVAASSEAHFKEMLDECTDEKTEFDEGWALCKGRFCRLKLFAGGLASMFPNTATVESDFSVIGNEKNVHRTSLTDFSLEGILHSKQFEALRSMTNQ